MSDWLEIQRGNAPLVVCFPHTGSEIPAELERRMVSPWLARKDADHWVHVLYDFAHALGATTLRTRMSRSVIDVNRDPSGASLYPGQATTALCPLTTFDGEPLYPAGAEPDHAAIALRLGEAFDPYHAAVAAEIQRLRARHARVVVYDAHAIRSIVPRLFDGELPHFNVGTNDGASCDPALTEAVVHACAGRGFTQVVNGRFKGGYITRHYGQPADGVHGIQMELACRTYLKEPLGPVSPDTWPVAYDHAVAEPARRILSDVLGACLAFANAGDTA
jgi:N-formylglutamate deformylase